MQKLLSIGVALTLSVGALPATCAAWSWSNPFSAHKTASTPTVSRTAVQEPSLWDKMTAGTKKFFSQPGEALGLKKTKAKKPTVAVPKTPVIQSQRKKESKSWFGPWIKAEEPAHPKTVNDWMRQDGQR